MPLHSIRSELAADLGIKINTAAERDYLDGKINKAAKEIWDNFDLRNAMREQIFQLLVDRQLITLPHYVYRVRKARWYESRMLIPVKDMRPRYHHSEWGNNSLNFRIVKEGAPLSRDIENQGPITITLSKAAESVHVFTIVGKTPFAARVSESITFQIGDLSKNTVANFEDVESINKNIVTATDALFYDMDGNEISAVPNSELKASFMILNVHDRFESFGVAPLVEVLYKTNFTPFKNDYDQFPCGDNYDRAIYFKTREHLAMTQQGEEATKTVLGMYAKCKEQIQMIEQNANDGVVQMLDYAPCPSYELFTRYSGI